MTAPAHDNPHGQARPAPRARPGLTAPPPIGGQAHPFPARPVERFFADGGRVVHRMADGRLAPVNPIHLARIGVHLSAQVARQIGRARVRAAVMWAELEVARREARRS